MVKEHILTSEGGGGAQQLFGGQNIQQLNYFLHTSITSVKKNRKIKTSSFFFTPIMKNAAHCAFIET